LSEKNSHKTYFSKDNLHQYVKTFSFPRLCGTEGEKKAVALAIKAFNTIGFTKNEIKKEDFTFSDFYSTSLIQLVALISLTSTILLVISLYIYAFLSVLILGLMIIFAYLLTKSLRHPEEPGFWGKYYGNTIPASNVFVKIPAKNISEKDTGNIIISAHLDSKSQNFKTFWRITIYKVWLFGGLWLGVVYLILLIYNLASNYVNFLYLILPNITGTAFLILNFSLIVLAILVSLSNITLMFLNTHNKSPGALDNSTGMAVVFELSSYFLKHKLDNFNLWFCQFSAEELGTMGSRIFVNKYENQFSKGKIFQINFDMVSVASHKKGGLGYLKSNGVIHRNQIAPVLSNYLENAAKEEGFNIKGFHLSTGAHTDCVPFHLREYDAIDLTTPRAARYTHTKEDTPDKVDPQVLLEACLVTKNVILRLDNDFKF